MVSKKVSFPNGVVVWEGASSFDKTPIVVILTGLIYPSHNSKTGPMVQGYVLRQDTKPIEAVVAGKDDAICGDCPLRRHICYVNLIPMGAVWDKYRTGGSKGYPKITEEIKQTMKLRDQKLRITAYGDAAFTPFEIWDDLKEYMPEGTGYTHQWRTCDQRWKKYLMASVENPEQALEAQAMGWRTFRVTKPDEAPLESEMLCPNVLNPNVTCAKCKLCCGSQKKAPSIIDPIHGLGWKKSNFDKLTAS